MKLDMVASFNFSWRVVHNDMLMRCFFGQDNLTKTISQIDSDQNLNLLHSPFKGTTLFREELVKLQKANIVPCSGSALDLLYPPALFGLGGTVIIPSKVSQKDEGAQDTG